MTTKHKVARIPTFRSVLFWLFCCDIRLGPFQTLSSQSHLKFLLVGSGRHEIISVHILSSSTNRVL